MQTRQQGWMSAKFPRKIDSGWEFESQPNTSLRCDDGLRIFSETQGLSTPVPTLPGSSGERAVSKRRWQAKAEADGEQETEGREEVPGGIGKANGEERRRAQSRRGQRRGPKFPETDWGRWTPRTTWYQHASILRGELEIQRGTQAWGGVS